MPNLVNDISDRRAEEIASLKSQAERCHQDMRGYLKITEVSVKDYLVAKKGYAPTDFGKSTLNNILNRCGYTLKKVLIGAPKRKPSVEAYSPD